MHVGSSGQPFSGGRASLGDPIINRNRKKDVAATQLDDVPGKITDWKLTCTATVPQRSDFNAVEIVDLLTQPRRRCVGPGAQTMPREFVKNLRAKYHRPTTIVDGGEIFPVTLVSNKHVFAELPWTH